MTESRKEPSDEVPGNNAFNVHTLHLAIDYLEHHAASIDSMRKKYAPELPPFKETLDGLKSFSRSMSLLDRFAKGELTPKESEAGLELATSLRQFKHPAEIIDSPSCPAAIHQCNAAISDYLQAYQDIQNLSAALDAKNPVQLKFLRSKFALRPTDPRFVSTEESARLAHEKTGITEADIQKWDEDNRDKINDESRKQVLDYLNRNDHITNLFMGSFDSGEILGGTAIQSDPIDTTEIIGRTEHIQPKGLGRVHINPHYVYRAVNELITDAYHKAHSIGRGGSDIGPIR